MCESAMWEYDCENEENRGTEAGDEVGQKKRKDSPVPEDTGDKKHSTDGINGTSIDKEEAEESLSIAIRNSRVGVVLHRDPNNKDTNNREDSTEGTNGTSVDDEYEESLIVATRNCRFHRQRSKFLKTGIPLTGETALTVLTVLMVPLLTMKNP
jgi:hypothetical protein